MEELVIYPKRGRMLGLGLISLLFSMFGLLFILLLIAGEASIGTGLIGLVALVFFGLCAIYLIKRAIVHLPALIISPEGITDNSSYIGAGLIEWKDLNKVDVIEMSGQLYLALYTYDPNLIVNRSHAAKKAANKANRFLVDSQINIPVNNLAYPLDQLLSKVIEIGEQEMTKSRKK